MSDSVFQKIVEWVISSSGAVNVSNDALAQVGSALYGIISQIASGALGAIIVALVAWVLITRNQVKNSEQVRRIERLRLLHDFDKSFHDITSSKCVFLEKSKEPKSISKNIELYDFETILTRNFQWKNKLPTDKMTPNAYEWLDGSRAICFSDHNSFVKTYELHQMIYWFRKVQRAFDQKIISDSDIYVMWRQILPFITDGRLTFLSRFFGITSFENNDDLVISSDIEPLIKLAKIIIDYCIENQIEEPLDYLGCSWSGHRNQNPRMDPFFKKIIYGKNKKYNLVHSKFKKNKIIIEFNEIEI